MSRGACLCSVGCGASSLAWEAVDVFLASCLSFLRRGVAHIMREDWWDRFERVDWSSCHGWIQRGMRERWCVVIATRGTVTSSAAPTFSSPNWVIQDKKVGFCATK